jgi:hypothetical protein
VTTSRGRSQWQACCHRPIDPTPFKMARAAAAGGSSSSSSSSPSSSALALTTTAAGVGAATAAALWLASRCVSYWHHLRRVRACTRA